MTAPLRVGIAGAGSVALGTAALLHNTQHVPVLWSPSGCSLEVFKTQPLTAQGAFETTFVPEIAGSAAELARGTDALILCLPAYGHKAVMDALAPFIRAGQPTIISSHVSFGALYLLKLLAARGLPAPVTAWGTTVVSGRRQGADVRVNTVRNCIDLCTLPQDASDDALTLCKGLFGDRFVSRDGLLAITLSNLNPQNHMGIALCNMSRMEHGEAWSQGQNVTPKVGRLMEQLDLERLAIAKVLGCEVKTIFEHFHQSFHVPVGTISEMNQQMHNDGYSGLGPATAESRYVTEDTPYGLVVTAALGRMVGQPATLHEAGIRLFSAMYDRDFSCNNDLLNALELHCYDLDDLKHAARTGVFPCCSRNAPAQTIKAPNMTAKEKSS
jgi:opine dehydrogenase